MYLSNYPDGYERIDDLPEEDDEITVDSDGSVYVRNYENSKK